jgi:hypothetical protein
MESKDIFAAQVSVFNALVQATLPSILEKGLRNCNDKPLHDLKQQQQNFDSEVISNITRIESGLITKSIAIVNQFERVNQNKDKSIDNRQI